MKPTFGARVTTAAIVTVAAFGIGGLLTQELYEALLVPWLSYFGSIPLPLTVVVLLPQVTAILAVAWVTRTFVAFLVAAASGGLAHHLLLTCLAHGARPGHHKSLALEAPDSWWTTELGSSVVFATMCLIFGHAAIRVYSLFRQWPSRHR